MDSSAELINKAKTCLQQKDYLQAEEIFNEALREEPDNQQAYFELGKICCIRQKYSEALEKLNKAISLEYNDACAHFLLAKAYKGLNQLQDALSEFKKALELGYEDNEDVHKDLYFIYRDLNKFSPAIEEFKRAFTTVSPELYQSELGKIYRGQFRLIENYNFEGRHSQAIEEIGQALKFIPKENPMFQNMLLNELEIAQKKIILSCKIRSLTVTLTNKCNLACIMCKIRNEPWDLSERSVKEIIALFPHLERIMWQGGEIFLYEGFKDLLKEASRFPMRQIIATNGLLMDREFAEIMVKSNVELTFSIDGATKEVYEHIRRGARFEKLIESVNLINEFRQRFNPEMETRMNVLVMRSNFHQLEQFLDFAKQHKFNIVFFNSTGEDFENLRENIFCHSRDEQALVYINKLRAKLATKAKEYGIRLENWLPTIEFFSHSPSSSGAQQEIKNQDDGQKKQINNKLLCHAPWQRLYIDCGGEVRPDCLCPVKHYVGNISKNSLEEMWNGEKLKEYRKRLINNNYRDFCNPDCVFGRVPEMNLKFI